MQKAIEIERKPFPENVVTLVSGYFDLLHPGHVMFLEACKEIGNPLVVGVYSDLLTAKKNLNRPIVTEEDRLFMVTSLQHVDYTFIQRNYVSDNEGYVLNTIRPKVIVYSVENNNAQIKNEEIMFVKSFFPTIDIQYIPRQRTDISTTQLIEKIVNL